MQGIRRMLAVLVAACLCAVLAPAAASAHGQCGGAAYTKAALLANWTRMGVLDDNSRYYHLSPTDVSIQTKVKHDFGLATLARTMTTKDNRGCSGGALFQGPVRDLKPGTRVWTDLVPLRAKFPNGFSLTPKPGWRKVIACVTFRAQSTCSNAGKGKACVWVWVPPHKQQPTHKPKPQPTPTPAPVSTMTPASSATPTPTVMAQPPPTCTIIVYGGVSYNACGSQSIIQECVVNGDFWDVTINVCVTQEMCVAKGGNWNSKIHVCETVTPTPTPSPTPTSTPTPSPTSTPTPTPSPTPTPTPTPKPKAHVWLKKKAYLDGNAVTLNGGEFSFSVSVNGAQVTTTTNAPDGSNRDLGQFNDGETVKVCETNAAGYTPDSSCISHTMSAGVTFTYSFVNRKMSPSASATSSCPQGGGAGTILLNLNVGNTDTTFVVDVNGTPSTVSVQANQTQTKTITLGTDVDVTVKVAAPGMDTRTFKFTKCSPPPPPPPTLKVSCLTNHDVFSGGQIDLEIKAVYSNGTQPTLSPNDVQFWVDEGNMMDGTKHTYTDSSGTYWVQRWQAPTSTMDHTVTWHASVAGAQAPCSGVNNVVATGGW
jgi:hypothetical protein